MTTKKKVREADGTVRKVWSVVFSAVGIALVVSSVLLGQQSFDTLQAVALNLGLVALAVVLIDLLWRICGGSPFGEELRELHFQVERLSESLDVLEGTKSIGLDQVYDRQGNFGTQADWLKVISEAENSVDMMGRTLFGWTRSAEVADLIVKKVHHDRVRFRWLVMDEENRYLPLLTEEDINIGDMLKKKLRVVEEFLKKIHDRLPEESRELFEVRRFRHVPLYFSVLSVDDRCYVTQYLFSADSGNSPFFCVRGAQAAWPKAFKLEFDTVWKESVDPFVAIDAESAA